MKKICFLKVGLQNKGKKRPKGKTGAKGVMERGPINRYAG